MSLDVTLYDTESLPCPHCGGAVTHRRSEVFDANITHNLGRMADAAGIYEAMWRPEDVGISRASQLAPILRAGLKCLKASPASFEELNAPNGWGTYKGLVSFVERYLEACEANPESTVEVSR